MRVESTEASNNRLNGVCVHHVKSNGAKSGAITSGRIAEVFDWSSWQDLEPPLLEFADVKLATSVVEAVDIDAVGAGHISNGWVRSPSCRTRGTREDPHLNRCRHARSLGIHVLCHRHAHRADTTASRRNIGCHGRHEAHASHPQGHQAYQHRSPTWPKENEAKECSH